MKKTEDGGPAFRSVASEVATMNGTPYADVYSFGGMSLRDWFAGQALAGCLSSQTPESHWAFAGFPQDEHNDTKS